MDQQHESNRMKSGRLVPNTTFGTAYMHNMIDMFEFIIQCDYFQFIHIDYLIS